jgi:hypothetical protein
VLGLSGRRDQCRAAFELKRELLAEMTKVSAMLHLSMQQYRRIKNHKNATGEERRLAHQTLDDQYQDCRLGAQVIEARLAVSFGSDAPRATWHKVGDLLTVYYFQLADEAADKLAQLNSKGYGGKDHPGLSAKDLPSRKLVLKAYRATRENMIKVLMAAEAQTSMK